MQGEIFYHFGRYVYKLRLAIILFWILLIAACLPFLPHIIAPFKTTGFVADNSKSVQADKYLKQKLGFDGNRFIVIYHSKKISFNNPAYAEAIKKSLAGLADFPIRHEIIYPDNNSKQVSRDKHTAYAAVLLDSQHLMTPALYEQFKASIKKPVQMGMQLGGEKVFVDNVNKQTQTDLYKADFFATPAAIITLLIVFGSVVAAILPIILGAGCALLILTSLYFIGQAFTLSIFTLNIALLLGLCLSLDYSLFIISRFREELQRGIAIHEAVAITVATAGKAVFFSGLAVFISLSALLLFPVNILFSVGVGGLVAVFVAVAIANILLPAILGVLNTRINYFSIRLFKSNKQNSFHVWRWLATLVLKHRYVFFSMILIFLLVLGGPFLKVKFGISDFRILPPKAESRQFFENYADKFDENELTPLVVIISAKDGNILSRNNIDKLYDFTHKLKRKESVKQVNSIVTTSPELSSRQYYEYYREPSKFNASTRKLFATTTRHDMTTVYVVSEFKSGSSETKALIKSLRNANPGSGLRLQLTGVPVSNQEVLSDIARIFPYAILWIVVLTYLILLVLLRSIFLPLKAILMNMLSLSASYGVLVFIFQEGHLHQLLGFDPQGMLDVSLLVIIFCALFGFSMDYEVFLLTRIREAYEKTHDNDQSIIFGLEHSSWIITSAALIVIVICCSFMVADVLMVKAFGLGIAVAIFVDAFLVRTLLVPSTMALVKQWNWYLPKWMRKLLS